MIKMKEKKSTFAAVLIFMTMILCGCNLDGYGFDGYTVETMKGWSFQYNSGTDDYSLFFGLCDGNERYVSASADVLIRIINKNGEMVYQGTKSVTENDFGTYTSQAAGERYLANVRIESEEIAEGTSSSGTVYFTVSNGSSMSFDEVQCSASYCLPIKDVKLSVSSLPVELEQKGYDGSVASRVTITDVKYSVDSSLISPWMTVEIYGQKTYGNSSNLSYDIISYKLYDSEGYLVESGNVYIGTSLSEGDKFKDDSLLFYDLIPGENYTLEFLNYEW